jgi:CubicO group peptidase (beta-lactamase class C family)
MPDRSRRLSRCVFAAVVTGCALAAAAQPTPREVERSLRPAWASGGFEGWSIDDRLEHHGVAGVQVAVIDNGRVAWTRGYGLADAEQGEPVTGSTMFQLGHLSMPVAAAIALDMHEDGVIDLDAPVTTITKGWRLRTGVGDAADGVPTRSLLSHTGGVGVPTFAGATGTAMVPRLIELLEGRPPAATGPVRQVARTGIWSFSAGGFAVLQRAIGDAAGTPYERVLVDRVVAPLGLTDTTHWYGPAGTRPPGSAAPHRAGDDFWDGQARVYTATAALGLWASAGDYAAFSTDLLRSIEGSGGSLLDADSARQMRTPIVENVLPTDPMQPQPSDWITDWAAGFSVTHRPGSPDDAPRFLVHKGTTPGYTALVVLAPGSSDGVVVLANQESAGELLWEIVRGVAAVDEWDGFDHPAKEPIELVVRDFEDAESCVVVGVFNGFDPRATPMTKNKAGAWVTTIALPPGTYAYRFLVDGQVVLDRRNPITQTEPDGTVNSRLVVRRPRNFDID